MSRHASPGQVSLFLVESAAADPADGSQPRPSSQPRAEQRPGLRRAASRATDRFGLASEEEAAALGRALLAEMREEPLSAAQQALLAEARAEAEADLRAPTPVVEQSETLLSLERGENAELRISLRRFKGSSAFLDIRRWERTSEGLKPTRQGITIRAREIAEVLATLARAVRC